jgi:hypothetical protein
MPTVTDVSTVQYSGDLRVDSLLHLSANWSYLLPARSTLYYSFDLGVIAGEAPQPVAAFNETQKAAARAILQHASALTGVTFAEVESGAQADFHFAACNLDTTGLCQTEWSYSYGAGNVLTAYSAEAYIYLDNVEFAATNGAPVAGSAGYEVLLHEIGHALGLDHPFDTPYPLPAAQDNTGNTVMSYTHVGADKTTFQPYDLLALSWIYGGDGLGGRFGYNSTFGPALDDYAAAAGTQGSLAVGSSTRGTIEQDGDRDWLAVTLQAGSRYTFALDGASSGAGTLVDPSLRLLSAAGAVLASNDDFGGSADSRIDFTAPSSGLFYLEAAGAGAGAIGTYRVSAALGAANRAPFAVADDYAIAEDGTLSADVLLNDSDPDGQSLTATLLAGAANGTVVLQPDGRFTYTPRADFNGADRFTYAASDGSLEATATVSIRIAAVNDAPQSANATIPTDEDTPASGHLPAATDVDGDAVTYARTTPPQHGSVAVAPDGRYTYTPNADYHGSDSFGFSVSDGQGGVAGHTASVTVAAIVDEIIGTALDDHLLDTSGDARLYGLAGNDRLQGGSGDDRLDGGAGIDTAVFARVATGYTLARMGAEWRVTDTVGADGTDTLVDVERLGFADGSVALDLAGAAGNTAKLIGAVFGKAYLLPAYVGIGIGLFDDGWSIAQVAGFALDTGLYAELAGSRSNADFVRCVYSNVVGSAPGAAEQAHYQGILDRGEMTQAQLAVFAAETAENAASIDLVGLASSGIEFIPSGT